MLDISPFLLTLKLAIITTLILFIISIPIAYWLAHSKSKIKPFIEAIVSLPLVLPPTVLGFYLLVLFSPNNGFGSFIYEVFELKLIFSFTGLVIGSVIYSLPFMVHPLQTGFASLPKFIIEASYMLGKSKFETLIRIQLPNIKQSILTGVVLTFAHTVGEFGVVLMIGGNIPKQTKVISIAIYDEVEALNYSNAHIYSSVLIAITFLILLIVYWRKHKGSKVLL